MLQKRGSVPVIILTILVLIALSLAGGGFYLYQKEHNNRLDLEKKVSDLDSSLKATETDLEKSKKLVLDLGIKLQDAKNKTEVLSRDLEQEKTARQTALNQVGQVQGDLDAQKAQRADLETKFTQAQNEVKMLQTRISDLETQKAELDTKVKDLEAKAQQQQVELGKIVVNPETGAPVNPAEVQANQNAPAEQKTPADQKKDKRKAKKEQQVINDGKVLVVNNKTDTGFAVINLGSKDGVNVGNVFAIFDKANNKIGDAKVVRVHDSMSAADFSSADMKEKVNVDDRVVKQ